MSDNSKNAADLVAAYVSKNTVSIDEFKALLKSTMSILDGGAGTEAPSVGSNESAPSSPARKLTAAQIAKTFTPEYIVSQIDGKHYKSLRRHLSTNGYTPERYKEEFGLPLTYKLVSANYSATRSKMAKDRDFGKSRTKPKPAPAAKKKSTRKAVAAE